MVTASNHDFLPPPPLVDRPCAGSMTLIPTSPIPMFIPSQSIDWRFSVPLYLSSCFCLDVIRNIDTRKSDIFSFSFKCSSYIDDAVDVVEQAKAKAACAGHDRCAMCSADEIKCSVVVSRFLNAKRCMYVCIEFRSQAITVWRNCTHKKDRGKWGEGGVRGAS